MYDAIKSLGFQKNTKIVNGFKPHFKSANDFLFIIGAGFGPKKNFAIDRAFKNYNGKVYGILTEKHLALLAETG